MNRKILENKIITPLTREFPNLELVEAKCSKTKGSVAYEELRAKNKAKCSFYEQEAKKCQNEICSADDEEIATIFGMIVEECIRNDKLMKIAEPKFKATYFDENGEDTLTKLLITFSFKNTEEPEIMIKNQHSELESKFSDAWTNLADDLGYDSWNTISDTWDFVSWYNISIEQSLSLKDAKEICETPQYSYLL